MRYVRSVLTLLVLALGATAAQGVGPRYEPVGLQEPATFPGPFVVDSTGLRKTAGCMDRWRDRVRRERPVAFLGPWIDPYGWQQPATSLGPWIDPYGLQEADSRWVQARSARPLGAGSR